MKKSSRFPQTEYEKLACIFVECICNIEVHNYDAEKLFSAAAKRLTDGRSPAANDLHRRLRMLRQKTIRKFSAYFPDRQDGWTVLVEYIGAALMLAERKMIESLKPEKGEEK